MVKGKFAYLAPEQVQGFALDRRCDVFALGIMLHELLTNTNPFRGETDFESLHNIMRGTFPPLRDARPEASAFQSVIERALAPSLRERTPSCAELWRDARAVMEELGVQASHDAVIEAVQALGPPIIGGGPPDEHSLDMMNVNDDGVSASLFTAPELTGAPRSSRWQRLALALIFLSMFATATTALLKRQVSHEGPGRVPESLPPSVTIDSDPAGATVLVDGILVTGKTPLAFATWDSCIAHEVTVHAQRPSTRERSKETTLVAGTGRLRP